MDRVVALIKEHYVVRLTVHLVLLDRELHVHQADHVQIRGEALVSGISPRPPFEQVVYEAMNFMDGKRDTNTLSRLGSAEFDVDLDSAWMDRLVGILAARGLVEK